MNGADHISIYSLKMATYWNQIHYPRQTRVYFLELIRTSVHFGECKQLVIYLTHTIGIPFSYWIYLARTIDNPCTLWLCYTCGCCNNYYIQKMNTTANIASHTKLLWQHILKTKSILAYHLTATARAYLAKSKNPLRACWPAIPPQPHVTTYVQLQIISRRVL